MLFLHLSPACHHERQIYQSKKSCGFLKGIRPLSPLSWFVLSRMRKNEHPFRHSARAKFCVRACTMSVSNEQAKLSYFATGEMGAAVRASKGEVAQNQALHIKDLPQSIPRGRSFVISNQFFCSLAKQDTH